MLCYKHVLRQAVSGRAFYFFNTGVWMICSLGMCFSVHSYKFLVKVVTSIQVFSALFYFNFWKSFFFFLFFSNFCFYSACSPFSLLERKRLQRKRFFCFVFYPGNFINLTDSATPQTVWLVQWRRAISGAGVGPSRGELLDSTLLPEKCLYNYTINVVFMLTLYKAY